MDVTISSQNLRGLRVMQEDKFNLKPIWQACLEIYKEVAKICERHGLRYYATDGTALGAVRHKGYIPWDDDFDISMPRPDYEKFKEYANTELPKHLRFWNYKTVPDFIFLFGKVQDTRREVVEEMERQVGHLLSNGSYIDIFPIDGYPESKTEILWMKYSTIFPKCIVRFKCMRFREQQSLKGRFSWAVGALLSLCLPWVKPTGCLAYCERLVSKHPFDSSKFNGRTCSNVTVLRRAPLKREAWGTPMPSQFEDTQVMLPSDVDAHLRNEYYKWDYMQLPPEKDRHPTHGYPYHFKWWLGPGSAKE